MSSQDLSSSAASFTSCGGGEEGSDVIVAQPPCNGSPHDTPVLVGGGNALEILDELVAGKHVGKEQAARLRRKYNHMQEALHNSRSVENSLLVQGKELGKHLSQQQHLLEKGGSFSEEENSETTRLRQILLRHQNELDQTQERVEKLNKQTLLLEEERDEVEKELSRMPRKEEIEQHIRELQRQSEELRDEMSLRSQDIQRYHDNLERRSQRCSSILQEKEELCRQEELFQDQLAELRTAAHLPREIESIRKQKRDIEARTREQDVLLENLGLQQVEMKEKVSDIADELRKSHLEVGGQRKVVESREGELEQLNKDIALAREKEASQLEERALMELHIRHRTGEYRSLYETMSKRNKEKDRDLRAFKKAELQLNALKQSLEQQRRQCALIEERVKQGGLASLGTRAKREDLSSDVEALRKELAHQVGTEGVCRETLEGKLAQEERTKEQSRRQRAALRDLSQDVLAATKARDHDAREFYKGKHQALAIEGTLKTQLGQIDEHKKQLADLDNRLKDFAEAYEVVKSERNKTHTQIESMKQLASELQDKLKVLENEISVLTTSMEAKDKMLYKCSVVHTAKVMERDQQRQELAKVKLAQSEMNSELESLREQLLKLTQQASMFESQLTRLRKHYEQGVQERNDLGLQLIERNEEVCVFHEKANVQESVLRKANMELSSREEEMQFLKMELSRLKNDITVQGKHVQEEGRAELDLVSAQNELKSCEQQLRALEAAVECASDPSRLRPLPGSDPTPADIRARTEKLEVLLSDGEHQLLERELLYEQVCKLTERCHEQVASHRTSTLAVARKVNLYQTKIKDITRKMMALVSELSMKQALALRLEQDVRENEVSVEQAYARLEVGDPPDEQAAAEWLRTVRMEERKQKDTESRQKALEEGQSRTLPGGVVTTAEPRPNAYIPSGEADLPLPKPYGSHAPFKPTEPGANIRHIRKPELKPIDI